MWKKKFRRKFFRTAKKIFFCQLWFFSTEMSQKRKINEKKIFEKKKFFRTKIFCQGGITRGGLEGSIFGNSKKCSDRLQIWLFQTRKSIKKTCIMQTVGGDRFSAKQWLKTGIWHLTPPYRKNQKSGENFFEPNRLAMSILLKKISNTDLYNLFPCRVFCKVLRSK